MIKLTERYESCPLSSSVRTTPLRFHSSHPLFQFLSTSGRKLNKFQGTFVDKLCSRLFSCDIFFTIVHSCFFSPPFPHRHGGVAVGKSFVHFQQNFCTKIPTALLPTAMNFIAHSCVDHVVPRTHPDVTATSGGCHGGIWWMSR